MAEEYITKSELARRTNRSPVAVGKLVKAGKIPFVMKNGRAVIPYNAALLALARKIDPAKSSFGREEQIPPPDDTRPALPTEDDPTGPTFAQIRTAQVALKVQEAQLELDRKKGTLVDREMTRRKVFDFVRGFRDAMMAFPARYVGQIAAEVGCDPAALNIALEARLREHLAGLAKRRFGG